MKNLYSSIIIGVLFFVTNCKKQDDPKPVSIDPTFQKYVDTFLNEATKRGKNIDLTKVGMTLQFGDTKQNGKTYGGIAFYETQSININKEYWDYSSEDYKELIVYHEMGHLLLQRDHFSKLWTNGEAQSIMYSIEDNFSSALGYPIFQGFRKKVYFDELFDPYIQSEPDWCKKEAANTPLKSPVGLPKYEETFDKVIALPETLTKIKDLQFSFISGAMLIQSPDTASYSIGIRNFLPGLNSVDFKNYEIRCRFRNTGLDAIIEWNQNEILSNLYSFGFTPASNSFVSSQTGYFYNSLVSSSFGNWNEAVLRYESSNVNVWLNGKLLFSTDIISPKDNDNWRFAFRILPKSTIEIDYLKLYQL
jgi:hypothetical protein